MSTSPEHYKQTKETIYFSLWKTHFSSAAQHSYWDPASAKKTKHRETWLIMVIGLSGVLIQFVIKWVINKIRWPSRGSPICLNEVKWNIYLTQLTTRSVRVVSEQSFGSSAVSLACIASICSVQHFPGSHSLHLAFGSFFYRLILAVFCCSVFAVSFFVIWLRLALCNCHFFVTWAGSLGGTFASAFGHSFCLGVSSATSWFESSTTPWRWCFRETERLWFCVHLLSSQAADELSCPWA